MNLNKTKPYFIYSIIVIVPTLIITHYLRARWENCGRILKAQEKIYFEKIRPAQRESIKIIFKQPTQISDYGTSLESLGSILNMASGATGMNDIYQKGKGMKVPSAICKAHANQYYRRWLSYPIKEILKEINNRDYYSIYERY